MAMQRQGARHMSNIQFKYFLLLTFKTDDIFEAHIRKLLFN